MSESDIDRIEINLKRLNAKDELKKEMERPHLKKEYTDRGVDLLIECILDNSEEEQVLFLKSLRSKLDDEAYEETVKWLKRLEKEEKINE